MPTPPHPEIPDSSFIKPHSVYRPQSAQRPPTVVRSAPTIGPQPWGSTKPIFSQEQQYFQVSLFADDVVIGLDRLETVKVLDELISFFEKASNSRVSKIKTFLMPLGSSIAASLQVFEGWEIKKNVNVKMLGVKVGPVDEREKEWREKVEDVMRRGKSMLLKGLPIQIKAHVINTRLFSKIYYLMSHNPPSDRILQQFQDFAEELIFHDPEKKRYGIKQLYIPRDTGGFGLIHLRKFVFPRLAFHVAELAADNGNTPYLLTIRSILQHQSHQ